MAQTDHVAAFQDFKGQVLDGISSHFPVKGRTQTLELESFDVKDAPLHSDDIQAQHTAKVTGKSWAAPIYGTFKLVDNATGKVLDRHKIRLADLPMATRRHGYIFYGQEYQATNQWEL